MQSIPLAGTSLSLSRLAFGTASLHRVGPESAQVEHLRAAFDVGFTHFDTAPLYGFGAAERALGVALGQLRNTRLTIATKVGLYPPGGTNQSRLTMLGRKLLGQMFPVFSRALIDWHVTQARASLDNSLTRLRRDHVDILLLHEPEAGLLETDEWLRWLEVETTQRVAAYGIAGTATRIAPFVAENSPLSCVVQMHDSLENREADLLADAGRKMQLTYGYLTSAPPSARAESVLVRALDRNRTGSIIVSTRHRARLDKLSAIAEATSVHSRDTPC